MYKSFEEIEFISIILNKDPKEWSKKEASDYCNWLEASRQDRVTYFINYFDISIDSFNKNRNNNSLDLQNKIYIEIYNRVDYYNYQLKIEGILEVKTHFFEFTKLGWQLYEDLGLFVFHNSFEILGINKKLEVYNTVPKKYAGFNLPCYYYDNKLCKIPTIIGKHMLEGILVDKTQNEIITQIQTIERLYFKSTI